jgi:hypothetical protein
MNLPQVLSVGVAVRSGHGVGRLTAHGGGRLTISPDAMVLEPGALTKGYTKVDRLVHSSRSVVMLKGRWLPPFINTRLVIEDGAVVAMASLPGWSRRRLRHAIRDAGFDLQERYGWSS